MSDGLALRSDLLDVLRAHEAELRARGMESVIMFGSLARGEATSSSDVDLAIRPGPGFSTGGYDYFGKLEELRQRLTELVGRQVDLVDEAAVRPGLKRVIAEEGVRAF